ncbi:hypothetical protein GH714_025637 [Hevea brasiliensis]|uniref:Uncharacterized protein n=1 Tax=Hevea brasiliensis TaxID=3981 RepID=A0A6A6L0K9_HEVBR|nr:hypothetical protein GH714_025637 [Hevea brasiliensis]
MTKSDRYYPDPPMEKDNVRGKAKVSTEITPEEIAKVVLIEDGGHITFSDHDLPAEGRNHSRALFVTVEVGGWKVPYVMIDDGAYDDSKRNVTGVFKTMVKVGPVETES